MASARSTGLMAVNIPASGRMANSMGVEHTPLPKASAAMESGRMVVVSDGHLLLSSSE